MIDVTLLFQVLCDFRSLQILYLQGNLIKEIKEVDKLCGLPKLRKLSLHGNPIDREKVMKPIICGVTREPHTLDRPSQAPDEVVEYLMALWPQIKVG